MTTHLYGAFFDLGIQQTIIFGIRLVVIAVAAIAGWYVGAPLSKIVFGLFSRRKPTPKYVTIPGRLAGALLLGFLAFLLTLGLGTSGGGYGEGKGDGNKTNDSTPSDPEFKKFPGPVQIYLVDADVYEDGSRKYYTIGKSGEPMTLGQVVGYLQQREEEYRKTEVHIRIREDSIAYGMDDCLNRLKEKINRMRGFSLTVTFP